jgi:hypothetical protein
MAAINKTTKKQFEVFKAECKKWLNYFGLNGWQAEYRHDKAEGNRGQVSWRITARNSIITLADEWESFRDTPITDFEIKKVAFHEVCEILLARITMMANNKIANHEDAVTEESHNIIRTLENTIFMDKQNAA